MIQPNREEFKKRAKKGNLIPVYSEIYADLETPVSAFLKLRRGAFNFLLESVEGGSQIGRYSFLGRDPSIIFKVEGRRVTISRGADTKTIETDSPLDELKKLIHELEPVADENLPPFIGGAVGYISYDMIRRFEKLPEIGRDDLGVPDMLFFFTDTIIAFDNVSHKVTIIHNVKARPGDNLDFQYDQATGVIHQILSDLGEILPPSAQREPSETGDVRVISNWKRADFLSAVSTAKDYIVKGDIIQAVLSQRLETPFQGDVFGLYRALRIINPSPYMFYLQLDDIQLIGSSPEVHVKSVNRLVTIRPIAGTRPRGKSLEEDLELEKELLEDEKEKA